MGSSYLTLRTIPGFAWSLESLDYYLARDAGGRIILREIRRKEREGRR